MTTDVRSTPARERLLRTASALFYAEGLRSVGVDRVVDEASVTRATFYRHFPGKEALVVAYLEDVDRGVRERVAQPPTAPDEAAAFVRRLTGVVGEQLCGPGFRGCPFINAAAEHPDPASPVRRVVREHRRWLGSTVERALGAAGHPDPPGGARRWTALRDGAMVAGYLDDPAQAQATLEAAVGDLLTGR